MRGYCVFELRKGDEVIRGTAREIAYRFNLAEVDSIYSAIRDGFRIKGYEVTKTLDYTFTENEDAHNRYIDKQKAEARKKYEAKKKEPKRTKAENLNYLKKHFLEYGYKNCYTKFDPFPYLPDLYELGLDCTAREWVSLPERYNLTTQHRSRKPKHEGYIVEVIERWTTGHSATI